VDRAVLDRHLVVAAGAVVGDRQRVGHGGLLSVMPSMLSARGGASIGRGAEPASG
jgi:hypothetical protein